MFGSTCVSQNVGKKGDRGIRETYLRVSRIPPVSLYKGGNDAFQCNARGDTTIGQRASRKALRSYALDAWNLFRSRAIWICCGMDAKFIAA